MDYHWILFVCFLAAFLTLLFLSRRRPESLTVGFFHPYADAGGGGERVLWHSVSALLREWPSLRCVIITGEKHRTGKQILTKVASRFGIHLPGERIRFVFLRLRFLVEASTWPRFTLIGQCLGSVLLGLEALVKCRIHVYFDTMGYAFTYPLFRWLAGCHVITYVHYPVVSTDMLSVVKSGSHAYNNSLTISRSRLLTQAKVIYYQLVAVLYGFVGRRAHKVMVNSHWTYNHIDQIWKSGDAQVVYPPCDVETFARVPSNRKPSNDGLRIVSIGQYRPEKNQRMQLEVIREVSRRFPGSAARLIMIGSCRDDGDHGRVEELRAHANQLNLAGSVEFLVNIPFAQLQEELGRATVAIHTMWNEHFGIGLVECMAAGCVMIGHRSGGPLMDIIKDGKTGFLADTVDGYADCIGAVLKMTDQERCDMVQEAKEHVSQQFSIATFEMEIKNVLRPVISKYID